MPIVRRGGNDDGLALDGVSLCRQLRTGTTGGRLALMHCGQPLEVLTRITLTCGWHEIESGQGTSGRGQ
jgi:hypothetical protein